MCYTIRIEDLAANALIEILAKNEDKRFVSYKELDEYAAVIVKILHSHGEKVVLLLSRENTGRMFRNYSNIFEEKTEDELEGISLKDNVQINDLIQQFRGYLALNVFLAFIDKRALAKLRF
ncbi:MAG: hypothetical protein FWH37_03490 [Candidatus Bathyarchaeota archaeon]|nr:hypothetical protein [Candidatus Termiticorpusculum sp.]